MAQEPAPAPVDDRDFEITTHEAPAPHIPPGDYIAAVVRIYESRFYNRTKINLVFQILDDGPHDGKYVGVRLELHFNKLKRYPRSSKLMQCWRRVAGSQPQRADRLSTKVFRNKALRVRVRDVRADSRQVELNDFEIYSVVDNILEVMTGEP